MQFPEFNHEWPQLLSQPDVYFRNDDARHVCIDIGEGEIAPRILAGFISQMSQLSCRSQSKNSTSFWVEFSDARDAAKFKTILADEIQTAKMKQRCKP